MSLGFCANNLSYMDAETKKAFELFGEALKATNNALDEVRAHLAASDARADAVIRSEIGAAALALDQALRALAQSDGDIAG